MKTYLLPLLFLATSLHTFAQGTMLLRQPTISNEHIAFVYANDLWIVGKDGGDARRLTSNEGMEADPHFSPDGKHIAFTGQYDGNTDVYLIPAEGGQPERLTWHPGADQVTGWTPDGEFILFSSPREGSLPTKESKIFKISKKGGMPEALPIPRAVPEKFRKTVNTSPTSKLVSGIRSGATTAVARPNPSGSWI